MTNEFRDRIFYFLKDKVKVDGLTQIDSDIKVKYTGYIGTRYVSICIKEEIKDELYYVELDLVMGVHVACLDNKVSDIENYLRYLSVFGLITDDDFIKISQKQDNLEM